ncbi:MAG: hypothetical protein U0165_17060 [Polyangiaceae bacterium]
MSDAVNRSPAVLGTRPGAGNGSSASASDCSRQHSYRPGTVLAGSTASNGYWARVASASFSLLTHLQFETLVAIKLLRPEVIKEAPEVMLRLLTEARSVVRLERARGS